MELTEDMQLQAKALADPSRFRLFQSIQSTDGPVDVAQLTELMGFNHNAVRQHLAVLVEAGLVAETDERRTTRGRPRKQYVARADALSAFGSVSGSYERLASLLLEVATGHKPYDVGFRAGLAAGPTPEPAEATHGLMSELTTGGFEPTRDPQGHIMLGHCPFANVAAQDQQIVCELHRGVIDGHLAANDTGMAAELIPAEPTQAGCRVTITTTD